MKDFLMATGDTERKQFNSLEILLREFQTDREFKDPRKDSLLDRFYLILKKDI
jgi:hypothetical protein